MCRSSFNVIILLLMLALNTQTYGQVDLTTELLLQRTGKPQATEESDDDYLVTEEENSRMVKQVKEPQPEPLKVIKKIQPVSQPKTSEILNGEDGSIKNTPKVELKNVNTITPIKLPPPYSSESQPPPDTKTEENLQKKEDSKIEYKRVNTFEHPIKIGIFLSPYFFINESQSNYWSRDYATSGTGYGLGVSIQVLNKWDLEVAAKYSLPTAIQSEANESGVSKITYYQQQFKLGPRFFSDQSRRSSVGFVGFAKGISIPKSSTYRISTQTEGLGVYMEHATQNSKTTIQLTPQLVHQELKNTSSFYKSGDFESGHSFLIQQQWSDSLGAEAKLEYGFSYSVDKLLFKDTAGAADPISGDTPRGVEVTDQTLMIFLNLTWQK